MRILGLPIWQKRLPDDEYIERVRKGLRFPRWGRFLYGIIGLAILVATGWLIEKFVGYLTDPSLPANQQSLVYLAFVTAIILGFVVGGVLLQAAYVFTMALFEPRTEQLLVDLWDTLQARTHANQQRERNPQTNPPSESACGQ